MRVPTAVLGLEEVGIGVDGDKLFGDFSVIILASISNRPRCRDGRSEIE